MPWQNKGLTVGLILISVVTTFAAVTFYMGRSAEYSKRLLAESQLEEVLQVKTALEREKEELTASKTELESKVQELEGRVTTLTEQAQQLADAVAAEKRTANEAREQLTGAQRRAEEAAGRLETERREKLSLADELAKTKQDTKRLQDDLTQLRQAKEALERRVKEMISGGGTPDIIVVTPPPAEDLQPAPTPTAPATTPPVAPRPKEVPAGKAQVAPIGASAPGQGSVLVVNREFNFIVVNMGSRDGIKPGQYLEVVRNGKPLARVQVERIYENMSAANILAETVGKGEVIKEGDQVRRG